MKHMNSLDFSKHNEIWMKLYERYPKERDEMTIDEERRFVEECFNAYEEIGFANKFWSPFDLYDKDKPYVGLPFTIIGRCKEGKDWDIASLPAWKIRFEDGHEMEAYPEEIYYADMINNGYQDW